jgi:secondary thiamine-phosphate synthase enzyme
MPQVARPLDQARQLSSGGGESTGVYLVWTVKVVLMKVHSDKLQIGSRGKGTYEFTREVERVVAASGVREGTVTVFVRHTSCSLVIMENAAPAARRDLERFFERLVPEGADYEHDDEGADDSTSHIRMALTRSSEVVPVIDGQLQLGTWQGLFLFEHRRQPHRRQIIVTVVGE